MVEISWGEVGFVIGVGMFLIGRKDLPKAAHTVGTQLGRVVGLLQGARARADQYTAQNELRQLQNELRSGLRELDQVRSELAVSMSTRGMMGRELGATVPSANRILPGTTMGAASASAPNFQMASSGGSGQISGASSFGNNASSSLPSIDSTTTSSMITQPTTPIYTTKMQGIGAVAEEEWMKQGIHFRSKAEQGIGSLLDTASSGSAILANALQQSLIHDQYDRVVAEQDSSLQDRMRLVQDRVKAATSQKGATTKQDASTTQLDPSDEKDVVR